MTEPTTNHQTVDLMDHYRQLKALVDAVEDDIAKAVGGNKAAGTRARKGMQEIKDAAQELRKRILEIRAQGTP